MVLLNSIYRSSEVLNLPIHRPFLDIFSPISPLFKTLLERSVSSIVIVLLYSKTGYNDDDVEVGRCVSRKINIQCSSSAEVGIIE